MRTPDPTVKHLEARVSLGKQYMQMLREVPCGDVSAWMACGCLIAAEAFERGISEWEMPQNSGPRTRVLIREEWQVTMGTKPAHRPADNFTGPS
jgi:hypothetical protein